MAVAVPASALFGLSESIEGTVQSIQEDTLGILSQKENTQKIIEVQINADTDFQENLASIEDLQKGDHVKVEYKEQDNQKIAVSVHRFM